MARIYIPSYSSNNCVVIQSNDIVRVYQTRPVAGSTVNYIDYYIHSDYYSNTGSATFSNYSVIPTCQQDITTDFYYRVDFDKIIVIFMAILVLCYFMAFKPIVRLMGRWLKL